MSTKHDTRITSVSLDQSAPRHMCLVRQGDLDFDLVQEWIGELLETHGDKVGWPAPPLLAQRHRNPRE